MGEVVQWALLSVRGGNRKMSLSEVSSTRCFGGAVKQLKHTSSTLHCDMVLTVFIPEHSGPLPVLFWLSGLTCTNQNFITKAGAQRVAAKHGIALICPDTSPRGCGIEGEDDSWDFGTGAGFYVNATQEPWSANYNMYSYVTEELPALFTDWSELDMSRTSIFGHSMGGHGALICALKNAGKYKSCSAFAPICNPTECAWGKKALTGYLGADTALWAEWDAALLAKGYSGPQLNILVDQGMADKFLHQDQLRPQALVEGASGNESISLTVREQDGYDHSYYFIATFVEDHVDFHAKHLNAQ